MHPQIIQQNRKKASDKSKGDKQRTEKAKSTRGSVTSAPKDRKILVHSILWNRAEERSQEEDI